MSQISDVIDLTADESPHIKHSRLREVAVAPDEQPSAKRAKSDHDDAGTNNELLEEWTCAICLDLILVCATLACGHSFCRSCIQSCLDDARQKNQCPTCRSVHAGGRLQQSFAADATIDKLARRLLSDEENHRRDERRKAVAIVAIPEVIPAPPLPAAAAVPAPAFAVRRVAVVAAVPFVVRHGIVRISRAHTTTFFASSKDGRKCRKCHSCINSGVLRVVKRVLYVGDQHYHIACMANRFRNPLKLVDIQNFATLSIPEQHILARNFV